MQVASRETKSLFKSNNEIPVGPEMLFPIRYYSDTPVRLGLRSKNPGPEDSALIHPRGLMKVATLTRSVQVSGVRFQVSATEVDPLDGSRS